MTSFRVPFTDGCGKVLVPNYSLTVALHTFVGEPLLMFWLLEGNQGIRPEGDRAS